MASDESVLHGLGPITGQSTATMAIGNMDSGGASGEEEWGQKGNPDNICSSSPWVALALLSTISSHVASPQFQCKPRSHVPRPRCPTGEAPSSPFYQRRWPRRSRRRRQRRGRRRSRGGCEYSVTETSRGPTLAIDPHHIGKWAQCLLS